MNNKIIAVAVILILVVGGFLFFKNKGEAPTDTEINSDAFVQENVTVESNGTGGGGSLPAGSIKEFNIEAAPFLFSPSAISVNRGDTVKITLKNVNGIHNWKIDEFGAATRTLNAGETQTITFVADKAGTFEFYCSVGNHRTMGMVGTLTVR